MWGCLCWACPFEFKWSKYIYNSLYFQHQIGGVNISYCCHTFLWLCAWGGCTIIRCRFHIYPGKAGVCFFHYCAVLLCAQIVEFIMARWSYSFVCTLHYLIIMQTYMKVLKFLNTCLLHFVECVSRIEPIPSILFHAIYGAVCIQHTHFLW